jgi:broad specificity phosphatase PhoE
VIVLARHGQTDVNRAGRLQGRVDRPLTPLGRAQADALGAALVVDRPELVFTSPLQRARQTADAIAARCGAPVEVDERLVELDYGDWDGRLIADIAEADWVRWYQDPTFAPPGGESLGAVRARMAEFCEEHQAHARPIVAVSHVSPIKAAVAWALGVPDEATWRLRLGVASLTRISVGPAGPVLATFNETAHLAALTDPGS